MYDSIILGSTLILTGRDQYSMLTNMNSLFFVVVVSVCKS